MPHAQMQTPGAVTSTDLIDDALPRGATVTDGDPHPRVQKLGASPDGNLTYCLWECSDGAFRLRYRCDEIVHVLEGSATITPVGGAPRTIGPGEVVYFEQGLVADWRVHGHIKKLAILRSVDSPFSARVVGKVRELLRPALRTLHLEPGK